MNRNSHIKTHFDSRVILSFITILLISGVILAFRVNEDEPCNVEKFKIQASSFKVGELITFSDYTDNAHEWKWDFGDGTEISFRSKVAHEYKEPGKYLVNLWVNKGCNIAKMVEIKPKTEIIDSTLLPKFHAPQVAYVGEQVSFTDSTSHAKSWEWRFGEGTKIDAIDKNPTYTFSSPGQKTISLFVNDDIKHVSFKKITVFPARKEKTAITMADTWKETQPDVVDTYINTLPDRPEVASALDQQSIVPVKETEKPEEKIEVLPLDEEKLAGLIMGLAKNKLRYSNFKRYFCQDYLPKVQLKDGSVVSLYYLNNTIRGKKIELKSVSMVRNKKNNCVSLIILDYKKKGLF
ncbi:PKD domain-containing protein [Sinomicrobium weinanense]|uniref:PKD domain-containing protein n=1 Tax=Sinomicrobium weinanense TaxID=2842200 RepID=A0A926JVL6_9FLAO|nr:PKD domain-containing protein [Sinomicrobium weinanense]MBC9798012.1 PKD domain-containing protein [Sinomicrobium weinanense]MBU3123609.1 PKD domain-containing protein [Sinomicrobium weinanense]